MVDWSTADSTELLNLQRVEQPGRAYFLLRRLCPFLFFIYNFKINRAGIQDQLPSHLKRLTRTRQNSSLYCNNILQYFLAVNLPLVICSNHSWVVKFFWRCGKYRVMWSLKLCRTSFTEHTLWTFLFEPWLFLLLAKHLPKWHILYEEKSVFHVHCSSPSHSSRGLFRIQNVDPGIFSLWVPVVLSLVCCALLSFDFNLLGDLAC